MKNGSLPSLIRNICQSLLSMKQYYGMDKDVDRCNLDLKGKLDKRIEACIIVVDYQRQLPTF